MNVPSVLIRGEGFFKFILAEIRDGDDVQLVVRADEACGYHREIYADLCDEGDLDRSQVRCLGGGYINVIPETRSIYLSGKSEDYGQSNHKTVAELIRESRPDFKVKILND